MGMSAIASTPMATHRLQCINPMTVLPEEYTARSQALTMLKRIESIEVVETIKRHCHRFYVIDIYFRLSRSHIPTATKAADTPVAKMKGPRDRRSDARVERRLSEICNLRDELYYLAHNGHGHRPCECCSMVVDYVVHGCAKPRALLRWLDSESEMHMTLTQFLNDVLRLTSKVKVYGGRSCQGQECIPTLLKQFLFPGAHGAVDTLE